MSADTLNELLNRVHAMVKCGVSTYPILAQETKIPAKQLWDILNLRRARPNGERALALHKWAEEKTVEIAKQGDKAWRAYQKAYTAADKKFPSAGGN